MLLTNRKWLDRYGQAFFAPLSQVNICQDGGKVFFCPLVGVVTVGIVGCGKNKPFSVQGEDSGVRTMIIYKSIGIGGGHGVFFCGVSPSRHITPNRSNTHSTIAMFLFIDQPSVVKQN